MAIGSAIEHGRIVYVYNENGKILCTKPFGSDGGLMGYTSTSFSVRMGKMVYLYNENCRMLSTKSV